jgi:hypothetical protein
VVLLIETSSLGGSAVVKTPLQTTTSAEQANIVEVSSRLLVSQKKSTMVRRTHFLLVAAVVVVGVVAATPPDPLAKYYAFQDTIGPVVEQYNKSQWRSCVTGGGAGSTTCASQGAVFCDAASWCQSFAVNKHPIDQNSSSDNSTSTSTSIQLYHADSAAALSGHPAWTLYSLTNNPPSPAPPPSPSPAPGPSFDPAMYCKIKGLAFEYGARFVTGVSCV